MNAEIIAVGTELLLGDIVNTNAQFISQKLSSIGINVFFQTVVGDNPERLKDCLDIAKSRSDIIITTGGLGPTYDDLTKETIAQNFGKKLVMNEELLTELKGFFTRGGRVMTKNNEKQALIPEGAMILHNENGTAPGCILEDENHKIAIMLPGPPREMKPLFSEQVMPYLKKYSDEVIVSKTMRIIGIGESTLEAILKEKMVAYENPTIAPYAKDAECILRVTAKAKDEQSAISLIDPVVEEIKGILGNAVYGVDIPSIEYAIVDLMTKKNKTVAFAESCTGGLCAKRITDIPGSSKIFKTGVIAYHNDTKINLLGVDQSTLDQYGAVSKKCALQMAKGVYHLSGADYGVAITGIAGPDGGTKEKPVGLCYICVYDGKRARIKKTNFKRDRDYVRIYAANSAFELLRKFVLTE